tara:strand:+ start:629 stop:898 length:270 start_codon:yes stop_codon:yes gene_type:complete
MVKYVIVILLNTITPFDDNVIIINEDVNGNKIVFNSIEECQAHGRANYLQLWKYGTERAKPQTVNMLSCIPKHITDKILQENVGGDQSV